MYDSSCVFIERVVYLPGCTTCGATETQPAAYSMSLCVAYAVLYLIQTTSSSIYYIETMNRFYIYFS